ncbi:dipeptidyl aminopeptidase/acylaminoacyl peptidase [Algoriphagus ratkowskyi]|uniref:Dipeptidyl aminopeptidase/acylaminoacyl peptidase n=1 Tax=Algoriphagus ratkowskyi TaxID=57028 RepID=A0A2W7R5K5_9BACT|nr:S9 family peptidase [Algoriphagus ratkowskyi]PZX55431.1 dipeptidyl aminopeptidase/acylaminoacyl peptidase [Algoriphagus ratkowskyi]TXD79647.1 S9 family peptidase [Algoriphagus ratkowskyi]
MQRKLLFLPLLCLVLLQAQAQSTLSVDYIMRDPMWMGTFPSSASWSDNSQSIYFRYNRDKDPADSLYKLALAQKGVISKVGWKEMKENERSSEEFNADKSLRLYQVDKKLMLEDMSSNTSSVLMEWPENFNEPKFMANEQEISFVSKGNVYVVNRTTKAFRKATNISTETKPKEKSKKDDEKVNWLETENLELLSVVNERKENGKMRSDYREAYRESAEEEFTYYTEGKSPVNLQISPDGKFATFTLYTSSSNKNTIVPDYVDASGFTTDLKTRSKVGNEPTKTEVGIYDLQRDTVYFISASELTGIKDLPDYVKDYPDKTWEEKERDVMFSSPYFSPDGKNAIINIGSVDNKDRWIASIELETGKLNTLDRQRDEAWISGPGIGRSSFGGTLGWLPDNKHIYFQSEESGYSHLYLLDVTTGKKKPLTSGNYEVFSPFMSKDKKSWYLTTSEVDPGERHFYKMPLMGGKMQKLTSMTGNNEVSLSPDEKKLAIIYSYSNKPAELYFQENKVGAKAEQLTSGQSEEFKAYNWRDPQLVRFTAEDGAQVPARLYTPDPAKSNGAAVVFVHGAGYLQNVHKWWSSYFREYMFHNLLTDLGYTVLDIDYRGSAGYGRDWRTGIYRHMGGKDLSDQVDGVKFLVANHGVDPERVGLYGGSYGGFITLMALFNNPETFKSGAALRSVTDWAHYNHGYTANILNTPEEDPIAYRRSSPIYFAEGLEGHLLMAHGMVDVNVHFQDVVRLSQRFIELGKDNWEMAIYPVEDHGFVEPSSWTDEYKRILKLFNQTLIEE